MLLKTVLNSFCFQWFGCKPNNLSGSHNHEHFFNHAQITHTQMPTQSIKTDNFTNACLVHTPIENIYFLNTQFWCATDSMLPGIWYKNNPQQYKNDVCFFFSCEFNNSTPLAVTGKTTRWWNPFGLPFFFTLQQSLAERMKKDPLRKPAARKSSPRTADSRNTHAKCTNTWGNRCKVLLFFTFL